MINPGINLSDKLDATFVGHKKYNVKKHLIIKSEKDFFHFFMQLKERYSKNTKSTVVHSQENVDFSQHNDDMY